MRTLVRKANEWDAPTMLKVYNSYVGENNCSPDVELPTIADFVQRIDRYTYSRGWMICEIEGETAGFCLLTENREDEEDMFSAEIQLYVKDSILRHGVGSSLYSLMLDVMNYGNKRKVIARIALPNDRAVAFHKAWGFEEKRLEPGAFTKCGKSYDVLVMEKKLSPVDPEARKPTKPFLIDGSDFEKARVKAGEFIKEI